MNTEPWQQTRVSPVTGGPHPPAFFDEYVDFVRSLDMSKSEMPMTISAGCEQDGVDAATGRLRWTFVVRVQAHSQRLSYSGRLVPGFIHENLLRVSGPELNSYRAWKDTLMQRIGYAIREVAVAAFTYQTPFEGKL